MPTTDPTTEQKIADAMRRCAAILQQQWEDGERTNTISLDDFTETLLTIADEADPPGI